VEEAMVAQAVAGEAALTILRQPPAMQTLEEVEALVAVVKEHSPQKRVAQALSLFGMTAAK
jgi:hypothetical protein